MTGLFARKLHAFSLSIFSDSVSYKANLGSFMGTLSWNCMGSKFLLKFPSGQVIASIEYESRVSSFARNLGPCRKITCYVYDLFPAAGKLQHNAAPTGADSTELTTVPTTAPQNVMLVSIDPEWNSDLKSFVLSFDSPTLASVKNFQLLNCEFEKVFSFNKTAKNAFNIKSQLSPFISFGLAISSIHRKICTQ